MAKYDKKAALKIMIEAAKNYEEKLNDKHFLIVYRKGNDTKTVSVGFRDMNFLHMTGVKTKLSAQQFYAACLESKLSEHDFEIHNKGKVQQKLMVLPYLAELPYHHCMIGDFINSGICIRADYFVGDTRAVLSVGFRTGKAIKWEGSNLSTVNGNVDNNEKFVLLELGVGEDGYEFASDIKSALSNAEEELTDITFKLEESIESLKMLTTDCDKSDYILAACSGAICGILDIFLVGKPGESPIGDITDKWFENRTMDFAKMCGWNDKDNNTFSSAIKHLEKKFKIPYDQRGAGDAASWIFDLNPKNHHFKSLGHNPTLLGLFFSVLDQFCNTSHFVSDGELISLQEADGKFELKGNDVPSKLFCGFANWFGHIISDVSGSSGTKGRGMGIPSPIWSWTNDIIAIKRKLNVAVGEFDKSINELALEIYKQGYDARFQVAQAIPVFINELLVRVIYSVRRLVKFFASTKSEDRFFPSLWKSCEPFSNATVKRMLTVAHGTFCLIDTGDAVVRGFISGGGSFNIAEFAMRLNIVGIGRFTISLYGEARTGLKRHALKEDIVVIHRQKIILEDYIEGLNYLAEVYDDKKLLLFAQEFRESDMYIKSFEKSVLLAQKRQVPDNVLLKDKSDIDSYFIGGSK